MTTTWWAAVRVQLNPIEARIRELCESADAGDGSLAYEDEEELDRLRAERRAILDGDVDDTAPTVAELREDLEFDVEQALEAARPKQRAADLRTKLDDELEQERIEREAVQRRRERPFDPPDESEISRHRQAVAAAGWQYCGAIGRHESGHVVAGIVEERRGGARVLGARFKYDAGRIVGAVTEFERDPTAVVWAAGAAAGQVLGCAVVRGDRISPEDAVAIERAGFRGPDRQELLLRTAARVLWPHAAALRTIADVLYRDGTISGEDARAIMAGRPRPRVLRDPAPFTLADFARCNEFLSGGPHPW